MFQSHLYGIESSLVIAAIPVWTRFQSHLYGIESIEFKSYKDAQDGFNRTFMELKVAKRLLHTQPLGVSIAPLWNWKYLSEWLAEHVWGFNRTFMELKDAATTFSKFTPKFQSHLYGIESGKKTGTSVWRSGFNRTFMELKVAMLSAEEADCKFQSHLYGIERELAEEFQNAWLVSIAPLWNWKLSVVCKFSTSLSFQSHLYGIERMVAILQQTRSGSFNRTFMELKVRFMERAFNWAMFQSHLYGIERKDLASFNSS